MEQLLQVVQLAYQPTATSEQQKHVVAVLDEVTSPFCLETAVFAHTYVLSHSDSYTVETRCLVSNFAVLHVALVHIHAHSLLLSCS